MAVQGLQLFARYTEAGLSGVVPAHQKLFRDKHTGAARVSAVSATIRSVKLKLAAMLIGLSRLSSPHPPKDGAPALQKRFNDRKSCYGCNVPWERKQRPNAAASSVLTRGRRRSSEIPASVRVSKPTSTPAAVASTMGWRGATS